MITSKGCQNLNFKCLFRYDFDGVFEATPGCRRAVHEAVLALQKNGHQVLPFCPPHLPAAMKVNSLYRAGDLGATNKAQLSIGPVSTQSFGLRRLQHRLPATLRTSIATGMLLNSRHRFALQKLYLPSLCKIPLVV